MTGAMLAACGPAGTTAQPDNQAIVQDFQQHRSVIEVTADGTVIRLLSDSTGPAGTHERFIIRIQGGDLTLLIDHNVSIGARVPVHDGDHVLVHGEYVWDSQGGLIHFTHHDPQGTHEGGYIQDNGTLYD